MFNSEAPSIVKILSQIQCLEDRLNAVELVLSNLQDDLGFVEDESSDESYEPSDSEGSQEDFTQPLLMDQELPLAQPW